LEPNQTGNQGSTNILVTGSTGFVGRHLVPRLRESGFTVHEFSTSLGQDILDVRSFDSYFDKQITHVIHLAGITYVPDSWQNPELFYRVNTLGTQHLLDFCRAADARLIFVSAYLYGVPRYLPIDEQHPATPNNPYAHSKWLAEELCRFYAAEMGVETVVLRPFNLYGPGQKEPFLIPAIISQAMHGADIIVKDDGPRRDYLHVSDFIEACRCALEYCESPFRIFNVGAEYSLSVREILEAVVQASGNGINWSSTGEIRQNEIPDTVADCTAIRNALNWKPYLTFQEGIDQLVHTWKII
jgi:nucleoside-diphosphate-sugar epimerase